MCTGLDQLLGLRQETGRTGSWAWALAQPPAFFKASSCLEGSCRHPEMKKEMWAQTLSTKPWFLSLLLRIASSSLTVAPKKPRGDPVLLPGPSALCTSTPHSISSPYTHATSSWTLSFGTNQGEVKYTAVRGFLSGPCGMRNTGNS